MVVVSATNLVRPLQKDVRDLLVTRRDRLRKSSVDKLEWVTRRLHALSRTLALIEPDAQKFITIHRALDNTGGVYVELRKPFNALSMNIASSLHRCKRVIELSNSAYLLFSSQPETDLDYDQLLIKQNETDRLQHILNDDINMSFIQNISSDLKKLGRAMHQYSTFSLFAFIMVTVGTIWFIIFMFLISHVNK